MTGQLPVGFAIGPPFWARLALVLPDPVDQLDWSRQGHDNEVGADFVANWPELFPVPDRRRDLWRRAVFPARAPFVEPGWVMYDARLGWDRIVELRRVEYRPSPPHRWMPHSRPSTHPSDEPPPLR